MQQRRAVTVIEAIFNGTIWAAFISGTCLVIWSLGQLIEKLFLTIGGWLF